MANWIEKVTGPVIPLPTAFRADSSLDAPAMGRYVEFLIEAGIRNVMTTVGTSRFNLLDFDEVKEVNAAVAKAAHGRANVIVANPPSGGTNHAIDFAKHAADVGADYFLLYYPERFYGDDGILRFFDKVSSAAKIKVLIHEMPMRNGFGGSQQQYSFELLARLFQLENVVGLKEEALDAEYSNRIVERFHREAVIIGAGGGMSRYLARDFSRGAKSFLGGIGGFVPQVELDFYRHLTSGNEAAARDIVEKIEKPYFAKVVPMGWHPSLKAALAVKGLLPAFEREPMKQPSPAEVSEIQEILRHNGWL